MIKVLTVVGRNSSMERFHKTLESHLSFPFKIKEILPLDQDSEAKNFMAYVDPGTDHGEVGEESYDTLAWSLEEIGGYAVMIHDSAGDAIDYVNTELGGRTFQILKQYPLSAKSMSLKDIFLALVAVGEIGPTRGFLDGEPVVVFVHGVEGSGESKDTLVTPYAILVDENLGKRLEISFPSPYKEEDNESL